MSAKKQNLKPIVEKSFLAIIKGTLDRIMLFEIDSIMDYLIQIHIETPKNAHEQLIITDKFYIYQHLWKGVLENLYEKFLPNQSYHFNWNIEITPYTLMLCNLTKKHHKGIEIERLKTLIKITDENIENDFQSFIGKAGFQSVGLKNGIKDYVSQDQIPSSRKEELDLLFRLMNFPPLGELALFINLYNAKIKREFEDLAIPFAKKNPDFATPFRMSEALHYSWFHLDHETFKKYKLTFFENHAEFVENKSEFAKIRKQAAAKKDQYTDEIICPCCGKKETIVLPEELWQYKYLLENQNLCKKVGIALLKDFSECYMESLSDKMNSFLLNLNYVDNPSCIILVEGESEEVSIPLIAFRKRLLLSERKVQVYNSKSKEKLAADFLSIKSKYPKRKIICLLDADAKKEKADIERVIKNNKDKYRLVFIKKGTFEDLFDLNLSVAILNELYPDGQEIKLQDFQKSKDFLTNIKRIMFHKKKATFDKVLFAKTISFRIDTEKLPKEISTLFQIVEDFSRPTKFVSQ